MSNQSYDPQLLQAAATIAAGLVNYPELPCGVLSVEGPEDIAARSVDLAQRIVRRLTAESAAEGCSRIAAERRRQVEKEGYTTAHDNGHDNGVLAVAAASLAVDGTTASVADERADNADDVWGLVSKHRGDRVRQLEIAGALIAAEIDRLLRDAIKESR